MHERIIVRTISNLSYAGIVCSKTIDGEGLLIKPSDKSNIKVFIPSDEIQSIVKLNGTILEGEAVLDECRLYESI